MSSHTFLRRLARLINRDLTGLRTQLVVDMTGLEGRLGIANAVDFEKLHDVPRNRVTQLEKDTRVELSRKHLLKLLQLEKQVQRDHPDFRLFELRRDPVWETFSTVGCGFIGKDLN